MNDPSSPLSLLRAVVCAMADRERILVPSAKMAGIEALDAVVEKIDQLAASAPENADGAELRARWLKECERLGYTRKSTESL